MLLKQRMNVASRCQVAAFRRPSLAVAAAAKGKSSSKGTTTSTKGFGVVKPVVKKVGVDGCPCGSGRPYKECCKPHHLGSDASPTVEDTVRARFSAILKKDVSYLLKTTSPYFHSFHYGGEPGAAAKQLEDDMRNTVEHYEYSNLKIREVQAGGSPDESTVVFQYTVYDKRKPALDDNGNKMRKVQIEESKFTRNEEGLWQFSEYRLAEVPEALAKAAELQAQDMAAAAVGDSSSSSSSSSSGGEAAAPSSSQSATEAALGLKKGL